MKRNFEFLGLNLNNIAFNDAILKLEEFIQSKKSHIVYTVSIELAVLANDNQDFRRLYDSADLLLVDSFGLCYIAKLFGKPINEPVNAARLMFAFLNAAVKKRYRIYFLGAQEEILNKAVSNTKDKYPGVNIVGWRHGYFDRENDAEVVKDICEKKPDILFVAMSSPLKERFIAKNIDKLNIPVCMGVGGSIDVLAGKCRLAPLWVSKIGLEWLFRFIQEPRRMWKRYLITNIKFFYLLMEYFFRKQPSRSSAL